MIAVSREGGIAVLCMTRTERGNALSAELVEALISAVETCIADPAINTLVLTSRGADFCTGFDLSNMQPATGAEETAAIDGALLWRFVRIEHLLATLWHAPLRTVAVVQGRAFGAGADLFAACDVRLAAADAQYRFPGAGFGIVLGTRRLGDLAGADRALAWVTTGASIDAQQAVSHGLATGVIPAGAWREHLTPLSVDRPTCAALRAAARADLRDADLAALVRSATRAGLSQRIENYRNSLRKKKPEQAYAQQQAT